MNKLLNNYVSPLIIIISCKYSITNPEIWTNLKENPKQFELIDSSNSQEFLEFRNYNTIWYYS